MIVFVTVEVQYSTFCPCVICLGQDKFIKLPSQFAVTHSYTWIKRGIKKESV